MEARKKTWKILLDDSLGTATENPVLHAPLHLVCHVPERKESVPDSSFVLPHLLRKEANPEV